MPDTSLLKVKGSPWEDHIYGQAVLLVGLGPPCYSLPASQSAPVHEGSVVR